MLVLVFAQWHLNLWMIEVDGPRLGFYVDVKRGRSNKKGLFSFHFELLNRNLKHVFFLIFTESLYEYEFGRFLPLETAQ